MKNPKSIGDVLLKAIRDSGKTPYAIAKLAKLEPDILNRFMHGRDIRISTASKIADVLGLELTKRK
jgi:hypothetical protein